jgi:hypothetical protein
MVLLTSLWFLLGGRHPQHPASTDITAFLNFGNQQIFHICSLFPLLQAKFNTLKISAVVPTPKHNLMHPLYSVDEFYN